MEIEPYQLPTPDLMEASKLEDPPYTGYYYSHSTVIQLLDLERARCAALVDVPSGIDAWEVIGGQETMDLLRELAWQIRSGKKA